MSARVQRRLWGLVGAVLLGSSITTGVGEAQAADSIATRPLATRSELEQAAARLAARSHDPRDAQLVALVRERLAQGDFRPGSRVLIQVQGEPELTDTFTVAPDTALHLPAPTVGVLPLHGVLRSELEPAVRRFVARFVVHADVRAEALLRLSVQGGVVHAGYYGIPADAPVSDALMAAGGTTPLGDMDQLRIERDRKTILEGHALHAAIADGMTLDQADLQDGDAIVVPQRHPGGFTSGLNLLWALVSIAGGVYGLSRAF